MKNYKSNFINDNGSKIIIVEADEFDKSFLHLRPDIALITSTDADHLDIYHTKESLINTFKGICRKHKNSGSLIIKKGTGLDATHFSNCHTYALTDKAQYYALNISHKGLESIFI